MNGIIRLSAVVNKVNCGNPKDCLEEITGVLYEVPDSDITVFPKLALSSPSCGSLFKGNALTTLCEEALEDLCAETRTREGFIIVGVALSDWGQTVSAMAVLHRGKLIALIPTVDPAPFANRGLSDAFLPPETVFACGDLRFCILSCNLSMLTLQAMQAVKTGCDLLIVPAYSPVRAGFLDEVSRAAREASKAAGCAIAVVNGGVGDTSSPYVYRGFIGIYECGTILAENKDLLDSFFETIDLDLDIIHSQKKIASFTPPVYTIEPLKKSANLLRKVDRDPFLPKNHTSRYLDELFDLQARSLAARMQNIGITKLVVGISGGLDSTAALLASIGAVDLLGLPRQNIIGITMPGFGTSDRTYYNALHLLEELGVSKRDISIRQAVQQHFEDIGHSGKKDTTYENAQARERAQILLDVANTVSGIVVGTGDLSEEALGFCTFAGDHIANYNVNVCITKTTLRALIRHLADSALFEEISDTLYDIIDTPVSPELLPLSETGELQQKTETILGPYELYDFILYHFVKYRFSPIKLYHYARIAFLGEIEPSFIKEKLIEFFRRFCAGQFKRACAPDSASITEVNLSGVQYTIPSDLDPSFLIQQLEQLEKDTEKDSINERNTDL